MPGNIPHMRACRQDESKLAQKIVPNCGTLATNQRATVPRDALQHDKKKKGRPCHVLQYKSTQALPLQRTHQLSMGSDGAWTRAIRCCVQQAHICDGSLRIETTGKHPRAPGPPALVASSSRRCGLCSMPCHSSIRRPRRAHPPVESPPQSWAPNADCSCG